MNNAPTNTAQGIQYDFFKNIKDRDELKQNPFSFTGNPIDAFLFAEQDIDEQANTRLTSTIIDTSVGHDGIAKNWGLINQRNFFQDGISEVGVGKISKLQNSTSEVSTSEVSTSEVSTTKINSTQISPTQISSTQIGFVKSRLTEKGIAQTSPTQISTSQSRLTNISPTQISTSQISPSQVGISQLSPAQVNSTQIDPFKFGVTDVSIGELPLSSSVSSQDFVNIVEHKSFNIVKIIQQKAIALRYLLISLI